MYKLCIALAFLAVAAAKPNFPLGYSGLEEFGYPYPAAGYPSVYPYNVGYSAPLVKAAPVVASTYTAPIVAPAPLVKTVAPVAPIAPVVKTVAPLAYSAAYPATYPAAYPAAYPGAYPAEVAPIAPVYSSGIVDPLNYSGYPFIVKKK